MADQTRAEPKETKDELAGGQLPLDDDGIFLGDGLPLVNDRVSSTASRGGQLFHAGYCSCVAAHLACDAIVSR